MKLKVCGMRDSTNIQAVAALQPDFLGFIFFEKSPRNVIGVLEKETLQQLPERIKKVGVFVNASESFVLRQVVDFQLDMVQLHGHESPSFCRFIKQHKVGVIKAFSVDETFDFTETTPYENEVDLFLFDTKAPKGYGGHGIAFDWKVLQQYQGKTSYLLAGGVSLENVDEVKKINDARLVGIDVNSKFEQSPAIKDVALLEKLVAIYK